MKKTKLKTLLLAVLMCVGGVQTALADYDGNTFYFKGMKHGCPGSGSAAAWQTDLNLYPYGGLNDSSWGGKYAHSDNTSIGDFFYMTNEGNSLALSKNIMCSYHQYPMTIPAYSKLVRRATFTLAFWTSRHYEAAGLYMFDTESAAKDTYVDMSYNQEQTKPAGHILSVYQTKSDSQWHEYYSGWVDITFDNSKGASKSDISKWFTFVQVSSNGWTEGANGKEQAKWTMNPTSLSGYGYTDTWHYYKYVTFVANGGTGSISQLTIDNSGSLTTNTITRTGYTFAGWNTQADGSGTAYADGGAITATSDSKGPVTLYAQWTPYATIGGTVITPNAALTLSDGSDLVVNNPVTVSSISYSRNLSYDWGTVCLPFAVTSDANVQYYTLSSVDATAEKMYFEPATTIAANTPAVFKRLNSGNYSASSAGSVTLSATLTPRTTGDWKLVGTFGSKALTKDDNANDYYIAQNQFWQVSQSENGVTIPAYRAYFTNTGSTAKASSLSISIWDGNEVTAIGTINANGDVDVNTRGKYVQDGRVVIVKNGKKYNTAGQQVK